MTRSLLLFATPLLASTAHAADQNHVRRRTTEDATSIPVPTSRVINGTIASQGDFPWFVLLDSRACGGTLISHNRVLTSANCVIKQEPKKVYVSPTNTQNGIEVDIECINVFPDYYRRERSLFNDLAVIKLLDSVPDVEPVKLNKQQWYPEFKDQEVVTMGFGYADIYGPLNKALESTSLGLLTTFDCQANFPDMTIYRSQHMCALTEGKGICTGDSGGPLMDGPYSNSTQIGITSFTYGGCTSGFYPDVFTRVASYAGWIQSEIESDRCTDDYINTRTPTVTPTATPSSSPTPAPTNTRAPTVAPTREPCFGVGKVISSAFSSVLGGGGDDTNDSTGTTYTAVADDDEGIYREQEVANSRGFFGVVKGFLKAIVGEEESEGEAAAEGEGEGSKDKGGGSKDNKGKDDKKGSKDDKDAPDGIPLTRTAKVP